MATYWKSVPRKFCEFCKCWITDNKPSVDFHERGKRHQENVKKRIDEVKKRSREKAKMEKEKESDLQKMEKAALEAFKKDLEANPELKARYLAKAKAAKAAKEKKEEGGDKSASDDAGSGEPASAEVKEWFEAKSPEGYSYYWSAFTGESLWVPPESFVSLAEQERLQKGEAAAADDVSNGANSADTTTDDDKTIDESKIEEVTNNEDVSLESIPLPVEDIPLPTHEIPLPSDVPPLPADIPLPEELPPPRIRDDPKGARASYGSWETVQESEPTPIDLELPTPDRVNDIPLPDLPVQEPKERFKEKKVKSLGSSTTGVAFKKRKLASGARNVRQRDTDD